MFGERPEPNRKTPLVPERLERLNRELTKQKRFDHVYATHGGFRLRVCVERCDEHPKHHVGDRDYLATATFAGRRFSCYGLLPSHAFVRLTEKLSWAIDKFNYQRNAYEEAA